MSIAPIPRDEAERLRALRALEVLDTPPDEILDGLVRTAAAMLGCAMSAVSLVDENRQWFKARFGIEAHETSRDVAVCAHAILQDGIFEIPDCRADSRFADNPLVTGEPLIRFYASVPIAVDGEKIGTFCVIDHAPHTLGASERVILSDLARAAQHWFESRRQHRLFAETGMLGKALLENLEDIVLSIDAAWQIRDANAHAITMLGYERRELMGLPLAAVMEGYEFPGEGADPQLAHSRHTARLRECRMIRKHGSVVPVEAYTRALDDRGFLVIARDVTERHARERVIRQHLLAIEQSFAGIMICDRDGTFLSANKAALEMHSYSQPEFIGGNLRMLESPSVPSATYETIRAAIRSGNRWAGTLHGRRKDGTDYAHLTSITPILEEDGDFTHMLIVAEDLTEKQLLSLELEQNRHHLEELAQRSRELAQAKRAAETASRAKSDFLASMSHEIRTPMNGVLGIVEVLRTSSLDPFQMDLTETIRESALALLGIIDEVLDFSKIEAGHADIKQEPVNLPVLAEGVCDALLSVANSRAVTLDVFVSPDLPSMIVSDEMRLRQLLNNLVGNAIKFSSGRSEAGRVWLRVEPGEADTFRMIVGDNGIGMARKVQKRVFEPFVQAEGSTTRRFGGTGLGLTICRNLVASFGGKIELKSAPEKGSVFTLTLPLQPLENHPAAANVGLLGGLHCHILLKDVSRARDWGAYLTAAGATVKAWRQSPSLQAMAQVHKDRRHVLIVAGNDPESARVQAAAADGGIAVVQVHEGTHRGSRLIRPGVVSLESGWMRRATLVDAVALATGRRSPSPVFSPSTISMPRPPDRAEAAAQGRLILVAEDNDLNRKVIEQQLALLGHAADVAVNGVEALARWRTGDYALLLTDLHMPYMDGYMLASEIRSQEAARGASGETPVTRLPIIALTANALRGEAERCIALGMDDYLTKPLQLEPLANTLARWLPPSTVAPQVPAPTDEASAAEDGPPAVYDAAMLRRLLGDDPQILDEVRKEFVLSAKATAAALRVAVAKGECATIESLAHRLKSSARAVGGFALGECCARLEKAGTSGPGTELDSLLVEFESALTALLAAMGCDEAAPASTPMAPPVAAIVVVDDEPLQLALMRRQLKFQRAPVMAYESARAALASLENCDTSAMLLLVDLNMPEMDGVELMRHLAERHYAGAIALISGADTRVLETATKLAAAYDLNVLAYLHKPVMPDAIRDVVGRWRTFIPGHLPHHKKTYSALAIRQGIDGDQLILHYQPKVSLKDGSLVGVEALVRWNHPVDGLLYPDRFIDVAESHDQIDALTFVVLEKAVAQARLWKDAGIALRVAVNISMRNLARLDFSERLLQIVERHGMEPSDLVLEVTESTLMADARAPLSTLTRLRMRAVGLSIDDFGTGHSSLTQLRDIPFDELKIDRGFVHDVGRQPTQQAIFLASLSMAHQLNMKVVAEGVEDAADWEFVRGAGCDVAQGYFIGRPMDASALVTWIEEWARQHREYADVQR